MTYLAVGLRRAPRIMTYRDRFGITGADLGGGSGEGIGVCAGLD